MDLEDVPPEEFVTARDALAKELKAAGQVAEAAEVRTLRKPTVPVWVAGQVRRHHDDVVDDLRAASAAVAEAQEAAITKGDRDALRDATARRKQALKTVGTAVEQVLARNGRPASYRDEVLAAIESAVTSEITTGTFGLRDDLELPKPKRTKQDDDDARRKATEAQAKRERELAAAQERVDRARRDLEAAESALLSAQAAARAGAAVVERHRRVEGDA